LTPSFFFNFCPSIFLISFFCWPFFKRESRHTLNVSNPTNKPCNATLILIKTILKTGFIQYMDTRRVVGGSPPCSRKSLQPRPFGPRFSCPPTSNFSQFSAKFQSNAEPRRGEGSRAP
jgi:hypothetical protein